MNLVPGALGYSLNIKCFKVSPYQMGDTQLLNFEQIILVQDAEEFLIKVAQKNTEEVRSKAQLQGRHKVRLEFWKQCLSKLNEASTLFSNVSPSKDSWLAAGTGISSIGYEMKVTGSSARVELYIGTTDRDTNKEMFDKLYEQKDAIEKAFGDELTWLRNDHRKSSIIKYEGPGNLYDNDTWEDMINFLTDSIIRLEKAFKKPLKNLKS